MGWIMAPIPTNFTHPYHPIKHPQFRCIVQMGILKARRGFKQRHGHPWLSDESQRVPLTNLGNLCAAEYHTHDWLYHVSHHVPANPQFLLMMGTSIGYWITNQQTLNEAEWSGPLAKSLSLSPSSSILPLGSNGWITVVHPLRLTASFWTPELWS